MKTMIGIAMASLLAAAGWAIPAQPESRRQAVLADAIAALQRVAEERNRDLKPAQAAWNTEMIRRLDGPVFFPSEHSRMHREEEPAERPVELKGQVFDASGARIPAAELHLAPLDEAGYPVWDLAWNTVSDDWGRFSFEDLPADRYHIRARLAGFKAAETRVDARHARLEPITLWLEAGSTRDTIFRPHGLPGLSPEAATVLSIETAGQGFIPFLIRKNNGLSLVGNRDYEEERLPFNNRSEREEAQARSRQFYAIALDLESGPQRFYPLLGHLAQRMWSQRESLEAPLSVLSDQQMVQALSAYLEYALYREWLRLEGISPEILEGDRSQPPDREPDEAQAQRWLDDWEQRRARALSHLVRLGCFDPPHRDAVTPFLSAFLGMSAPFLSRRAPLVEETPQQFLAIPFGMVTVYLDHPDAGLTVRTFVIHD